MAGQHDLSSVYLVYLVSSVWFVIWYFPDATNLENVYVRVMQKHAKETKTDLKLKSGKQTTISPGKSFY